ncbi:hypothetical protein BJV78DRAFT_1209556 [Lactifluus subvellereus]|nr:hypothetical protein BJV78DRAFT_1209556 [Lactifluus subvellereus]
MVTCLSALTKLEFLTLRFQSRSSCPYRGSQRSPLETRIVLPALTELDFQGVSGYLDDLLARIDTPVIRRTKITFFNQDIFGTPHLLEFVSRAATLRPFKRVRLYCYDNIGQIELHPIDRNYGCPFLRITVLCHLIDWQVSFLVHICNQFSPLLSSVESLYIRSQYVNEDREDDMDHARWLEIFRPFIALQSLRIKPGVVPFIAPALQELTGDRVMEVLPALHSISLGNASGSAARALDQFIAARQLSGHPVTVQSRISGIWVNR